MAFENRTKQEQVTASVRGWVERVVVGLNLCPFAGRELASNSMRFFVSAAADESQLLDDLVAELQRLEDDPGIETTLLIHPDVLQDFMTYNEFLNEAENLLVANDLEGIYQIASFHPDYQFADTQPDDVENYTNRSPYPMLHLLREESLEQAIRKHPDTAQIPGRNIALLQQLGNEKLQTLLAACEDMED